VNNGGKWKKWNKERCTTGVLSLVQPSTRADLVPSHSLDLRPGHLVLDFPRLTRLSLDLRWLIPTFTWDRLGLTRGLTWLNSTWGSGILNSTLRLGWINLTFGSNRLGSTFSQGQLVSTFDLTDLTWPSIWPTRLKLCPGLTQIDLLFGWLSSTFDQNDPT